jgi:hypothetical protein
LLWRVIKITSRLSEDEESLGSRKKPQVFGWVVSTASDSTA